MARARLTADVEPDLRRRVKIAAVNSDRSVSEWIETAVRHELQREDLEEREYYPSEGGKPQGSKSPPRPRSGRTVAEAVIEDRR